MFSVSVSPKKKGSSDLVLDKRKSRLWVTWSGAGG